MKKLHDWFFEQRRDFPWRVDPSPYRVWISEVMLQQTRAVVVIPYFERWMALFPNIRTLAEAPLEQVIKVWEGLGYYSRARNLHAAAKDILDRFGGKLPDKRADLETIRGLGPYTVGAILSFGFRQRAAAVDGNVIRVLSRFFAIEENVSRQAVKRLIWERAEQVLDEKTPWVTAEALIELGATLCGPRPKCGDCPLQLECLGYQTGRAEHLPIKNSEKAITALKRGVAVIEIRGSFLLRKPRKGKVMADLYEFPYFEGITERTEILKKVKEIGISAEIVDRLSLVKHAFTRYKAELYPFRLRADKQEDLFGYEWVEKSRILELPFSAGHKKILLELF